jgi:hypothetical protein
MTKKLKKAEEKKPSIPPISFPLLGQEKHTVGRLDPKLKKPAIKTSAKKLTPELLEQIARVQGTKRRIYKKSMKKSIDIDNLRSIQVDLYDVINSLKEMNKNFKGNQIVAARENLKTTLNAIIDSLAKIDQQYKNKYADILKGKSIENIIQSNEIDEIFQKLTDFHDIIAQEIANKQLVSNQLIVKSIGIPEKCNDCGGEICQCFVHLSKPIIKSLDNKQIQITFGADWIDLDIENYLKSRNLAKVRK